MNPESKFFSANLPKPNSRSSSVMTETDNKRRRLVDSQKNNMFRPTPGQSVLIQNQLTQFFKPTESTTSSRSSSTELSSPLSNLHLKKQAPEKTRHELFLEQLRLREEYKRRQKEAIEQEKELAKVQYENTKRLYLEEQQKREELEKKAQADALARQQRQLENAALKEQQQQYLIRQQKVKEEPMIQPKLESPQQVKEEPMIQPKLESPQQQQQIRQQNVKVESDDDIIIDEEMTNKNVCIGMVKTDIVVEKSPLILIRDEQYEIVSLESEGKLNTDNYSFKVTSRSQPPKFYGWVPFKDTKILGPLVDHRLIWWDAVIPRGKATNTRTPLCIILYCRPDLLVTIAKYFESQRLFLKTPPFYNPACRYSNPHHQMMEQTYQPYSYQQQQYQYQNRYQQTNGPYHSNQQYAVNNYTNERQSQKDIQLLLESIPNDVPQISLKKKKKKLLKKKKRPIIILSDEEDEENDFQSMPIKKEEEEEEEEEDSEDEFEDLGYVEGLKCYLMEHQIKGVSWMIDRENNHSNGGILADMGLGKTIQTIALIASTMTSEEDEEEKEEEEKEEIDNHKITLIVTPLALIHQWVDEIQTKTEKGKLKVLMHHGPNRTKNFATFKRYDVVVTTYQVVASDMPSTNKNRKKKQKDTFIIDDDDEEEENEEKSDIPKKFTPLLKNHGPLFQLNWHRVVLDEAQFIKNRTTKASLSCASLFSVKRWCLTGTPIQNNVDELYSLLRFLRITPLCDFPTFKKNISIPIMNGDNHIAMNRLKAVLMAVMLRRTKTVLNSSNTTQDSNGEQIQQEKQEKLKNDESLSKKLTLKLPTREKTDVLLTFTDYERKLYDLLKTRSKESIQSMVGTQNRYMNMLCLLLRLRQACDHPLLILDTLNNDKDVLGIISDANTTDNWSEIERSCELCGKLNNDTSRVKRSPYCNDCLNAIESNNEENDQRKLIKTSTKIRKLIEILNQTRKTNPGEKTIIFSQFTSMLDLLEAPLKQEGFKICRYDGSMSNQLRERSLSLLKHDTKTTVMLISLKCGSLGLNLTAANRVILIDIWWNPALEEQAIDRVHRIGQKLPVHVTRLLVKNTVELKIVELQEKKAQLTQGALGDGLVKNARLTASEMLSLFDV